MTKPRKPNLTLLRPDDLNGIEAFILKTTGERLTPEDRARLESAFQNEPRDEVDLELEDPEDICDAIYEHGKLVAYQDWDSGGPGGGAGRVSVYRYRHEFYVFNDSGGGGPFASFDEAAEWSGVLRENDATVAIWVDANI